MSFMLKGSHVIHSVSSYFDFSHKEGQFTKLSISVNHPVFSYIFDNKPFFVNIHFSLHFQINN